MNNHIRYQDFLAGEHATYQANIMKNDTIAVIKQIAEKILPISDTINNVESLNIDISGKIKSIKHLDDATAFLKFIDENKKEIDNVSFNINKTVTFFRDKKEFQEYIEGYRKKTKLNNFHEVNNILSRIEEFFKDVSFISESLDTDILNRIKSITTLNDANNLLGQINKNEINAFPSNAKSLIETYGDNLSIQKYIKKCKETIKVDNIKEINKDIKSKIALKISIDKRFKFVKDIIKGKSIANSDANKELNELIKQSETSSIEIYESINTILKQEKSRVFININSFSEFDTLREELLKYEKIKDVKYKVPQVSYFKLFNLPEEVISIDLLKDTKSLSLNTTLIEFITEEDKRADFFLNSLVQLEQNWISQSNEAIKNRNEKIKKYIFLALKIIGALLVFWLIFQMS